MAVRVGVIVAKVHTTTFWRRHDNPLAWLQVLGSCRPSWANVFALHGGCLCTANSSRSRVLFSGLIVLLWYKV